MKIKLDEILLNSAYIHPEPVLLNEELGLSFGHLGISIGFTGGLGTAMHLALQPASARTIKFSC